MKNDLYTKIVLTVIAVSLAAIALRPSFSPQLVHAASVPYEYNFMIGGTGEDDERLKGDRGTLNEASKKGWEVVAMTTLEINPNHGHIFYILRRAK